jgi:LytS/YehU family sensor histidine kinase
MKANFLIVITVKIMIVGIVSAIKLLSKWAKLQKKQQLLEKEKLEIALKLKESELKFLKSQINPHFLFNALNNLYGLTLEKSDVAPDTVLKISELLDYMLHDCNVEYIDLIKEIKSLENYIDLQKIRYDDDAIVQFDIDGDAEGKVIAPLLLLPFVENAFKHGLTRNLGKGKVEIKIFIEKNGITFTVENDYIQSEEEEGNHGIGLKNVKKRLDLQYKDRYELQIKDDESRFCVYLYLFEQKDTNSVLG